jgi:hypothetical protein
MTAKCDEKWVEMLEQLKGIVEFTSDGEIVLLRKISSAEDFIITCLVAQFVAHKAGKAKKEGLSTDEVISAGGLAYRPAKQTIYNATSGLAKTRILTKDGKDLRVGERIVVQFFSTKLPEILGQAAGR